MTRPSAAETKVVICVWHPFTEWRPKPLLAEALRSRWPEMNVVHLPNFDRLPEALPGADIFVGYSLRANQLTNARKLKWIHSTAAGVAQLIYPELRDSGIAVTNSRGILSATIAEHALGLMIALARNFPCAVRFQDQRHWAQQELWDKPQRLRELAGQTLLIVGLGSIGQQLATRALAFQMRVLGVTRSGKSDSTLAEQIFPASDLDSVLPLADYVVLAAPETPETKSLIGAKQFARMKRDAVFINVARGSLLDEASLITALETSQIAGAALDVTATEPLPPDSLLWTTKNLFITPHISAVSESLWPRQAALFVALLERWFAGEDLFNIVDFSRGY